MSREMNSKGIGGAFDCVPGTELLRSVLRTLFEILTHKLQVLSIASEFYSKKNETKPSFKFCRKPALRFYH